MRVKRHTGLEIVLVWALSVASHSPTVLALSAATTQSAREKIVATMGAAAKKAFDEGDFQRAGELYLDLYRQDPGLTAALFSAARSYHLAGLIDKADELYVRLTSAVTPEPALLEKARLHRADIAQRRADRKAQEASRAERDGHYDVAAGLWTDAHQAYPANWGFLAKQARALHLAGKVDQAREAYRRYHREAPADAPDQADVRRWMAELDVKGTAPQNNSPAKPALSEPADRQPAAATPAQTLAHTPQQQAAPDRTTSFVVLGAGAAVAVSGLIVYLIGVSGESTLNAKLGETDAAGTVIGITEAEAREQSATIANEKTAGVILGAVGAVGAGVGIYLFLADAGNSKTAHAPRLRLVPTDKGVSLCGVF